MSKSNITLPRDRDAKVKLLKELLKGEKTLDDLEEDSLEIQMNLNPTDEERAEFTKLRGMQDSYQGDPTKIFLTIDIGQ
jgi:hypothetical protein